MQERQFLPCPVWPMQKTDGSRRKTVNYHHFNQLVAPVVAAAPDVISWLEQVNTHPGEWYVSLCI